MLARTLTIFVASVLSIAAQARVISYSPYTNRIATPVAQERNSRHFALLEAADPSQWDLRQLVLYDTEGEEPRVVFPPDGGEALIVAAALYQAEGDDDGQRDGEVSLLVFSWFENAGRVMFSGDAGRTWKQVPGVTRPAPFWELYEVDTGGPYVRGLTNPIRTGNDANPFVVSKDSGVWKIAADGTPVQISTRGGRLVGQNRAGTEFLVARQQGVWPHGVQLEKLNVDGSFNTFAMVLPPGQYYGWIASNDSAYVVGKRQDGRFLHHVTSSGSEFIRGPYGVPDGATNTYRDPMHFIAVPTNDFNGAWMVQREPGKPSNLARHTIAGGLEEMGSDATGPEIEALIAGESGDTLLIQVHRDRSETMMRTFIDPALAVWRVGTPMPREYDELYLAEEENKGFVHVDVDRMEAGEAFVFDSGSFQDDGGVIISPAPGGGGDVIQEWGVVRASLKQRVVLPGVARLPGAYGSFWMTDVTLFNPMLESQQVAITYVPIGVETSLLSRRYTTVTLAGREVRAIPDALAAWFGLTEGGGVLHLEPERGINAFARTYNRVGEGTYGFGMMAIDYFNAASARFPVTFAGAFPGEHFRTNVLITDTSGHGTAATLDAYGVSGAIGTSDASVFAPAGGIMQFNSIGGGSLDLFSRETGGLVVQPTKGSAIATVVAIDNRTNDPTYFTPDVKTTPQTLRAIPVIGHVDGANGSRFRSDLYLYNPGATTRIVVLEATRWDAPVTVIREVTLLPNEARTIVDALSTLFQLQGLARLQYWSSDPGDGVTLTSRTYTIDESGATYGSLVPPLNNFQVAGRDEQLEIIGVSGGGNFRTNLALVEMSLSDLSGPPVGVRIHVINDKGLSIDTFAVQVPRAGGMQINDLFGSRGVPVPAAALIVLQVLDQGLITGYATLTDNITNDTTYLGPNLGARPE